jgi:hypothetical protein
MAHVPHRPLLAASGAAPRPRLTHTQIPLVFLMMWFLKALPLREDTQVSYGEVAAVAEIGGGTMEQSLTQEALDASRWRSHS